MANLKYFVMVNAPMKEVAENPSSAILEAEETTIDDLKETGYLDTDTVMTVCDNFITIYGYKTWFKKFGGR